MAKKDIHPDYHEITVAMTTGKTFKTKSCYGKQGSVIKLDVDPNNHPAWRDDKSGRFLNAKNDQVSKFNKKFGSYNFGFDGESEKPEEKPEEKSEEKSEEK